MNLMFHFLLSALQFRVDDAECVVLKVKCAENRADNLDGLKVARCAPSLIIFDVFTSWACTSYTLLYKFIGVRAYKEIISFPASLIAAALTPRDFEVTSAQESWLSQDFIRLSHKIISSALHPDTQCMQFIDTSFAQKKTICLVYKNTTQDLN